MTDRKKTGGIFTSYIRDEENAHDNFDDLARLAAGMVSMQVCLVNLVDGNQQKTIGSFGVSREEVRPEESICQYTVLQNSPLEVENLGDDPRFNHFKSLHDFGINYYYGIPLFSSAGSKIGALCVLDTKRTALTNDKRAALQLIAEQASRRLADFRLLNEMQKRLAASEQRQAALAHDIRGPLFGISALSELAIDDLGCNNDQDIPLYLQHIKESGRSLLDLADGILTENKLAAEETYTDVAQIKRQLKELFMPNAVRKKIALTISAPKCHIGLPKTELLQAIANLVANAIKFTPQNGVVDVEMQAAEDEFLVLVTDTGVGISNDKLDRLFNDEGFTTNGTAGEKGTGLGLAAVNTFVKSHDGVLSAVSVPGEGSCFRLTFTKPKYSAAYAIPHKSIMLEK